MQINCTVNVHSVSKVWVSKRGRVLHVDYMYAAKLYSASLENAEMPATRIFDIKNLQSIPFLN